MSQIQNTKEEQKQSNCWKGPLQGNSPFSGGGKEQVTVLTLLGWGLHVSVCSSFWKSYVLQTKKKNQGNNVGLERRWAWAGGKLESHQS